MPTVTRRSNDESEPPITLDEVSKEAQSLIDKVVKDVGKSSATKQLIIGGASGWVTGFLMMKIGKMAAVTVGGSIILLQLANHKGYININWDKVIDKADKAARSVEASTSSKKTNILDKVERYVDKKMDKAETLLKKKERKAKRWFYRNMCDEEPIIFEEFHVFLASFVAGLAFGMALGMVVR
uniref:FUN14 domain-containing protein 1B n=1 Tax=Cacopsylla melanoneura TaxID=428564 RepID=A0A8D8UPU4_9HEMI